MLLVMKYVFSLFASFGLLCIGSQLFATCATGQIELNTDIPFVGKCIDKSLDETTTSDGSVTTVSNAFPKLMG